MSENLRCELCYHKASSPSYLEIHISKFHDNELLNEEKESYSQSDRLNINEIAINEGVLKGSNDSLDRKEHLFYKIEDEIEKP